MGKRVVIFASLVLALVIAMRWVLSPGDRKMRDAPLSPAAGIAAGDTSTPRALPGAGSGRVAETSPLSRAEDCFDSVDDQLSWTRQDPEEAIARFDRAVTVLSASDNAEHLLAAAMIASMPRPWMTGRDSSGAERQIEESSAADIDQLMQRAVALGKNNPLVLRHAVARCLAKGDPLYCDDAAFSKQVDEVLAQNGAYWSDIAAYHAENDAGAALSALMRASLAPEYSRYFVQQTLSMERALRAASDFGYLERLHIAIGIVLSSISFPTKVVALCRDRATEHGMWDDACVKYAERLAAEGETILETTLALHLLGEFYRQSGNRVALEAIDEQREQIRGLSGGPDFRAYNHLLLSDESFAAAYMDEWAAGGELAAMEFARRETERRIEASGDDVCSGAEPAERRKGPAAASAHPTVRSGSIANRVFSRLELRGNIE